MDPVMRILQIQSQTLICPGKVCLLSQVMMSSVILRILRAIQTAATRKSYLTSSLVVSHPTHQQQLSHLQLRLTPVEVRAVGVKVGIITDDCMGLVFLLCLIRSLRAIKAWEFNFHVTAT